MTENKNMTAESGNNKSPLRGDLEGLLRERILVIDGAMGTMLQRYDFSEVDFRGKRFKDYPTSLKGNNDLLSLTQPEAIAEIHRKYFQLHQQSLL